MQKNSENPPAPGIRKYEETKEEIGVITQEDNINDKAAQTIECEVDTMDNIDTHYCQEFSTVYPFSFNIFLPSCEKLVQHFIASRFKLITSNIRCRLRFGMNTFDTGCLHGPERLLRVESRSEAELVDAIDILDINFPTWNVWQRGKCDEQLIK